MLPLSSLANVNIRWETYYMPVVRKRLIVEQNTLTFGTQAPQYHTYGIPFDLAVLEVTWCHSVHTISNSKNYGHTYWNLWLRGTNITCIGYLLPCIFQGHFAVIQCTFPKKMACNSKMAGRGLKRSEIYNPGTVGTFERVMSTLVLDISCTGLNMASNPQVVGRTWKTLKFGAQEQYLWA